ncbi:XRE family transcriptional regulator [Streptomyces eurocidicus]|uniref:Transcriptional regulator with XRE-family HTH domain n=1 Tax=Streptomyces eurocidicus TaxID=66423 RepID=A0A2N8NX03_STREU|nr:helix-turn-helix transcriptional regulator [Streptomyces eurocidicus]MBB5117908.1 transcriptional regulator with XRE-family HTH domain [Streptomyces eurocidicus]MBF6053890.1 helix-turn-helix domain-containing protein [Streptomyces eurocidicus]PNE33279.1 XRE family transcriptional regulator [Streptomyces eurocidicus]
MSSYRSPGVEAARRAVAAKLREVRLEAGLTGHELAVRCGWHKSKSSRIENARTPPSDTDIRKWCEACGAADQAADIVAASRTADSMYTEWRRLQRTGLRRLQESRMPLYERTKNFRGYASHVVPGLFQTPAYASALLSVIGRFHGTPDDTAEAVRARMSRARVLHEGEHRFALLVEESVLRYQIGDAATMAEQLGHLLSVMALPSVSLGVIPFGARERGMWTLETFNIFDEERVHVELLTAQVTVTAPGEIALYVKAFRELRKMALYGTAARALVTSAIAAVG